MKNQLKRTTEIKNIFQRVQRKPLAAAVTVACATGFTPPPVSAELEEVTVTATRRAQSVQEIPYNITAFSSEQLEAARGFNLGDIARLVPGLVYKDQGPSLRSSRNTFILRGLNANDGLLVFGSDVSTGPVSMYFGEAPIFFPLIMKDVERVEVLRGPQGTLYGSGSLGGTIRFIPNEASFDGFSVDANARVSTMHASDEVGYGGDIVINAPLVDDRLALRLVANWDEVGGFIDGVGLVQLDSSGFPTPSVAGDTTSGFIGAPEEDTNDSESFMVRASLHWVPTDAVDVQVSYTHQNTEVDDFSGVNTTWPGTVYDYSLGQFPGSIFPNINGCNGGGAYAGFGFFLPCAGPGGNTLFANGGHQIPVAGDYDHTMLLKSRGESEADLVSAEVNVDLGFASVTSSTTYSDVTFENTPDFSGFPAAVRIPGTTSFAALYGFYPRILGQTISSDTHERFSQEIRLISTGDNKFDYVVGAYYEDRKTTGFNVTQSPGLSDFDLNVNAATFGFPLGFNHATHTDITFTDDRKFEFEDIAIFGELTWHVNEQWQITGGIRAFWQDFSHDFDQTLPFCGPFCSDPAEANFMLGGTTITDSSRSFEDQIFKINTSYNVNDDMMVYFTWAEGFRHGGANALQQGGRQASVPEFLEFEPDEATNWEIGIKGRLSQNLNYSLAAYLIEWDKFQFESFNAFGFKMVLNGDEAETYGVELELNGALGEGLTYQFGYSYVEAELTKDFSKFDFSFGEGTPLTAIISAQDGDPLPSIPKHSLTFGLDYLQPLKMNNWSLNYHFDGRYASSAQSTFNQNINFGREFFEIDSYSVFNASIGLESNANWSASLFVRNIGNEQNFSAGNTGGQVGAAHQYFYTLQPRTVGFEINYRYH